MEAIEFPEQMFVVAKDQPEYIPLPVHATFFRDENGGLILDKNGHPIPEEMTCCFKLSPGELEELNLTGVFWHTQCVFGNNFQPVRMSTQNPFIERAAGIFRNNAGSSGENIQSCEAE